MHMFRPVLWFLLWRSACYSRYTGGSFSRLLCFGKVNSKDAQRWLMPQGSMLQYWLSKSQIPAFLGFPDQEVLLAIPTHCWDGQIACQWYCWVRSDPADGIVHIRPSWLDQSWARCNYIYGGPVYLMWRLESQQFSVKILWSHFIRLKDYSGYAEKSSKA